MVLFDETRVLNPQADKTNVALSFSVPPGLTALQVEFTYDPPTPPEPVAVEAVKAALARYARAVVQKDPYAYLPVYNLWMTRRVIEALPIGEPPSSAID